MLMPASQPAKAMAAIETGMAISNNLRVGFHLLQGLILSIRRPTPNSPHITHMPLAASQALGSASGLSALGISGIQPKLARPNPINSAEAAGSRPEKNLGNQ